MGDAVKRYAKRRDDNEPPIVEALRKAGATVQLLEQPADLLVGFRGRNTLLEVKNPATRYGRGNDNAAGTQHKQRAFRATWRGVVEVVTSPEEALRAIGVRSAMPEGG